MTTRFSSRIRWAGLLAATALVVSGCASTDDGGDNDNSSESGVDYSTRLMNIPDAGEPVKGGTLRVAEYSEARSLNPALQFATGATGGNVMAAIYDTLVAYDPESGEFVPQMAESLESEDDTTWTIKLREGVKFHDGTPFNADAVKSSLEFYAQGYGLNAVALKSEMESITAPDDLTVVIKLKNPWATFPNMLSNGAGMIMAPAAYANPDPAAFKPIGAGAFKFESYAPAEKTVVVANPDYFDGAPNIEKIEFLLLGADKTAYDSYKSGDVDVAFIRATELVDEAINDKVPGSVSHAGMSNNLWLNSRKGSKLEDPRVRRAIYKAFDPKIYLQRVANGAGQPSKLILGPGSKWAADVEEPGMDTDGAKKLVEEAKADGFDGKVRVLARTEQASQAGAVAIKAMLEAVGFEVELDLVQNVADQTAKIYVDADYDIATAATSIHDENVYGRYATMVGSNSTSNASGYANPEMDALIAELQGIKTPEEATETLTKIQELFAEDAPGVPISAGAMLNIWQKNVHGVTNATEATVLFDDAWITK